MAQNAPIPQAVTFYTWNTQGNFTQGPKAEVIQQMLGGNALAMTFVQEGGVNLEGAQDGYTAEAGAAIGAFNERCTNYILYNDAWGQRLSKVTLVDANNSVLIGGGIAGRTPAAVSLGKTLFVCWHSLSAPNNLDTGALLRALQKAPVYKEFDQIILGGDFNATPEDVERIVLGIAVERGEPNFTIQIVRCHQPTLKAWDKEYDFFILFQKAHEQQNAQLLNVVPSDHQAVRMDLLLVI